MQNTCRLDCLHATERRPLHLIEAANKTASGESLHLVNVCGRTLDEYHQSMCISIDLTCRLWSRYERKHNSLLGDRYQGKGRRIARRSAIPIGRSGGYGGGMRFAVSCLQLVPPLADFLPKPGDLLASYGEGGFLQD